MEPILNALFKDLPQQFHDKAKIEVLFRSYSRQLEEIKQVFYELDNKTNLEDAEGVNLDNVGGIVNLTRREAGLLAGIDVIEPVISDERYRQFLKYKVLTNTSNCTYSDLITGNEMLWGIQNLHYVEDKNYPATIIFASDELDIENAGEFEFDTDLCIRSSGIGVLLRKRFGGQIAVETGATVSQLHIYTELIFKNIDMYLSGRQELDGGYELNGYRYVQDLNYIKLPRIDMKSDFIAESSIGANCIVEKDLSYLDGKYDMSGCKKLDAEIIEMEL